ncbi:MAG: cupin domain-containing protein [Deltaproteobacteria bacterium]|nr:MAG: cupin domain-containing protein [Deltaproteobacteria bacterium]
MARLKTEDGTVLRDLAQIQPALEALGVQVKPWPTAPEVADLLASPSLDDAQKERVLQGHDRYFEQLQRDAGYQSRDLIVLHDQVPNLDQALAKFSPAHTHDDDEVRYIVDGEGVFGFTFPDGQQAELLVEAGEYINVPADTEHWFHLTERRRIKAVRYFSGTDGWVPNYTGTTIRVDPLT